jgi:DNA-binding transcriptional ArsR family regulator
VTEPEDLDELLRAVANRHRRRILVESWTRELGAGELADQLGLAPASVSEHLKVLRKTGLVTMRADGTYRLYRASPERLRALSRMLTQVFPAVTRTDADHEVREDMT